MTTPTERTVIWNVYQELKARVERAKKIRDDNADRHEFHQIWDEAEERKVQREAEARHRVYDTQSGVILTLESVWTFYKSLYSDWDINLALQEHEGRIGELNYVEDSPTY